MRPTLLASLLLLAACGPAPTPPAPVTCQITATTTYEPTPNKIVTGKGEVSCDKQADLSVNVCLYSQAPGASAWGTALICQTRSVSTATTLTQSAQVGIATTTAKSYRTVVTWTIDGVAQTEQASSPITAP